MNISNFISHINQYTGPALANRFRVDIVPPSKIFLNAASLTKKLSFQCEAAELPGRTLATLDARTYGPTKKYPYQTTYNDLSLTFICMGNTTSGPNTGLWEKTFFDTWMNYINPTDLYNFRYKSDYQTEIIIHHYDTNSNESVDESAETYTVDFLEAFPTSVNQLQLGWGDDSVLKLTVTFAYTKWENRNTKGDRANFDTTNKAAIDKQVKQNEAANQTRREAFIAEEVAREKRAQESSGGTNSSNFLPPFP